MDALGVIEGGWEYVWSAYGLTAAILFGYAASVHLRYRAERARRRRAASPTR
ncbi:MAG TPA: heme exporter protein CcmD [Vicinamibacteria bacterium]|nr:heme exporter protein CcmD [Vicinamibacteria bacterium]